MKPKVQTYEVFRKRGRGWQLVGTTASPTSDKAAWMAAYIRNYKVVGTRLKGSTQAVEEHRFEKVPEVP